MRKDEQTNAKNRIGVRVYKARNLMDVTKHPREYVYWKKFKPFLPLLVKQLSHPEMKMVTKRQGLTMWEQKNVPHG